MKENIADMRIFKACFLAICLFFTQNANAQDYTLSKKDTSEVRFVNSRKFWIYKVDKGETLFSISRKFNIPQEEIHQFNPDLNQTGLKAKMKIWIPAYSWLNKNSEKDVTSIDEETGPADKSKYRIALMTGLNLPGIYTANSGFDSNYVAELLPADVNENLEFLEGAMIAFKEHSSKDHKIEFVVIDTKEDSVRLNKSLIRKELIGCDMLVTNENNDVLRQINKYSIDRQVPLISGAINSTDIIRQNEKAISLTPSSLLQCELMGKVCGDLFRNANFLLLKTGLSREDERLVAFKKGWNETEKFSLIKNVNFSNGFGKALKDSLSKTRANILFVPTSNEDIISSLLSSLKEIMPEYKINVIGLPTWLYSQSIDPDLFDTCRTFLFSAGNIDFSNSLVNDFRRNFRDHYHSEPTESAYLGYDAASIAVNRLFPVKHKKSKDQEIIRGLYTTYKFISAEDILCKENNNIQLFRFENGIPVNFKMNNAAE